MSYYFDTNPNLLMLCNVCNEGLNVPSLVQDVLNHEHEMHVHHTQSRRPRHEVDKRVNF